MTTQRLVTAALAASLVSSLCFATYAEEPVDVKQELTELYSATAKLEPAEAAKTLLEFGLRLRKSGHVTEARKVFEAALAADGSLDAAHEALGHERAGGKWYTHDEAMKAKGLIQREGVWMLAEEARILDMPANEKERRKDAHAKVNKLLRQYAAGNGRARDFATKALAGVDDAYKVEPFAYALRSTSADVRKLAAAELGRLKSRRALRPLVHRAVMDRVEDVRHAALDAAKAIGDDNLLAPLVRALHSETQSVRVNAADAISRLGDVRGVQYLVYKYEARGGGAPRVFFMNASQLTFIQDFDVEVAQTAFIADPSVGVIQEGTVLDAQVIATSEESILVERDAIHGALRRLTGAEDVKNEKGAWARWYRDNEETLVAKK